MLLSEKTVRWLIDRDDNGTVNAIETILPPLSQEHGIESAKIFQAFYYPASLANFDITIILSNNLNIAFMTVTDSHENISLVLRISDENKKDAGPKPPNWKLIDIKEDGRKKRWVHFLELDDPQITEFVDAMSCVDVGGLTGIFTRGDRFDDPMFIQYGRYFETPHFSHRFFSLSGLISLSNFARRDYFRYFLYPLIFFEMHSTDSLIQDMMPLILNYYE